MTSDKLESQEGVSTERANYITCPKGHKVFVIWSHMKKKFGFTCDECGEHSEVAVSENGFIVSVKILRRVPKTLDS